MADVVAGILLVVVVGVSLYLADRFDRVEVPDEFYYD